MAKSSPLELCETTLSLGNSVAVHILEYMNKGKDPPHSFNEVAIELLELGRVLLAVKSGLSAATHPGAPRVPDSLQIGIRLRQANVTITLLDQAVNKLVANQGKKGIGKLGKSLRSIFSDVDLGKLRTSMVMSRETLKLLVDENRWSAREDKALTPSLIGYTALAAVLGFPPETSPSGSSIQQTTAHLIPESPIQRRPTNLKKPSSVTGYGQSSPDLWAEYPHSYSDIQSSPSLSRHDHKDYGYLTNSTSSSKTNDVSTAFTSVEAIRDRTSEIIRNSLYMPKDLGDPMPKQPIRVSADPSAAARRRPQNRNGTVSPAAEMALVNAISQKNHRTVEQLLDQGVNPDHGSDLNLLKEAVVNRDLNTLRYLLLYGGDPNGKDKSGQTPLYAATELNFVEAAQLLVDYGADPDVSAGPNRDNPLAVALTHGSAQLVQLFLKRCADVDCMMDSGFTPLTRALNETVAVELIELLLLYGADVNRKNSGGESALFKAILAKRLDLVVLLLDRGADPNLPAPKHMLWPAVHNTQILNVLLERGANLKRAPGVLELATSINSLDAVTTLLSFGADPNAKKDGIFTPLCTAIRDDREQLVEVLIGAGADPNLPASEYPAFKCVTHHRAHLLPRILVAGANPSVPKGIIETAVAHNEKDALMVLLKHKVDSNARGASGETALTRAIRTNNLPFIDILLAHHADPSVRGQEWPIAMAVKNPAVLAKLLPHIPPAKIIKGALEMAVVANQLDSVKLLLAKGISVEEKNGGVFSPLTTSIREDRKEIFRYLIDEAGADPNAPGEHLPIIKAIRRHRAEDLSYIEHLLRKGADINLMYRGWNAVLQAVDDGDVKVLELLANSAEPDLSARDETGRSVLEIIKERGLKEEERILLGDRTPSPDVVNATAQLNEIVLRG